jgi:hypothetical protein
MPEVEVQGRDLYEVNLRFRGNNRLYGNWKGPFVCSSVVFRDEVPNINQILARGR